MDKSGGGKGIIAGWAGRQQDVCFCYCTLLQLEVKLGGNGREVEWEREEKKETRTSYFG
jgi:hypothetical protein